MRNCPTILKTELLAESDYFQIEALHLQFSNGQRRVYERLRGTSSLSFSPVLVYEFAGQNVKPYVEAGIGVALFSRTQIEDNNIGESFQFEDRLGFGLRFAGGHEIGIRATHYSNAGINSNNGGVESYALHYTMPL